jgi:hypothetical protein
MKLLFAKCDICGKSVEGTDWKWHQEKGYHIGCLVSELVRLRGEVRNLTSEKLTLQEEIEDAACDEDAWDEDDDDK